MDLVSEQHHSSTLELNHNLNEVILCRLRVEVEQLIVEQGCELNCTLCG
jgi:hypothetical protein